MEDKEMKKTYTLWLATDKLGVVYTEEHNSFLSAQMAVLRFNAVLPEGIHADFVSRELITSESELDTAMGRD
jgi:hypothetical protein